MSKNPEHDELIENIKRPTRYYRITISGWGGEIAYDTATKEKFEYWNSAQAKIDCGVDEDENALSEYLWSFEDDPDRYANVPENVRIEGNWYEQDGIEHLQGATVDSAMVTVEELESESLKANVIKTLVDYQPIYELLDDEYSNLEIKEVELNGDYVFFGMSVEKGTFFEGLLETQGPIDLKKLSFVAFECHNGDEIITDVYYDGDSVESWECDTNGKDMIIEIVEI
jgi:hypothetical protein